MARSAQLYRIPLAFSRYLASLALIASTGFAEEAKFNQGHNTDMNGFNDMLESRVNPGTFVTEQEPDGSFVLKNSLQTVSAHITERATQFESTGGGEGSFTVQLSRWGREDHWQAAESSKIYRNGDTIFHTHNGSITEKFSNAMGGIQQDFIVPVKPEGGGALHVGLRVSGADVKESNTGANIQLSNGRNLTYDRLAVTDAAGKSIPAHIMLLGDNMLDIVVDDNIAQYPLTIDPTVGNANWLSMGNIFSGLYSGPYTGISAWAIDESGNVYAAGNYYNGSLVGVIAQWTGTTWNVLGTTDDQVNALAVDDAGNLYVGGDFDTAGSVSAYHLAKWNGSAWSSVGVGVGGGGYVNALAVDSSDNLYVGGDFSCAGINFSVGNESTCLADGGTWVLGIAKWNGSSWSALESPGDANPGFGIVNAMVFDSSGNLYVGGEGEDTSGGLWINNIARWDGTYWYALGPSTHPGLNGIVNALAIDGYNNLYVGGSFATTAYVSGYPTVTLNYIAKWDGSTWNALGTGMNGYVYALAVDDWGRLFAGGPFSTAGGVTANLVATWNNDSGSWGWSALGSGVSSCSPCSVNALALNGQMNNLYVGGTFNTAGATSTVDAGEWLVYGHPKNDYDGDGKSDALFINTSTRDVLYWPAAVSTASVDMGSYSSGYAYLASGDFDGDGKEDLLFSHTSNNGTMIWPDAIKASATYPGAGSSGFSVSAVCDVDGDGQDDIIWMNSTTGGTQVWPSGVKANVYYPGAAPYDTTNSVYYNLSACSDFDGDGQADLFWRDTVSGADKIWYSAVKTSSVSAGTNSDLTMQVVGATNNSRVNFLIWYKPSTGDIVGWGAGLSSNSVDAGTNSTSFTPAAIGDYDGDSSDDLLWGNSSTLSMQIWPSFQDWNAYSVGGSIPSGYTIQK
jgi:hypothetical protein